MYRNTRFGELMKGLPRADFERMVKNREADKHGKGFRCWDQVMVMVYGQLSGASSLRELTEGFNSHTACHYHLGTRSCSRSTLADANAKRDVGLYADICQHLLGQVHGKVRREVNDMLYLLDSTPIPLKGFGYDEWASSQRTRRTQGLKVHMLYSLDAAAPMYGQISAPNVNDIEDARGMAIEAGATYVFDKAYCDYQWWHQLDQHGATFVTRFKRNAALQTEHVEAIPPAEAGTILADERVSFTNRHPGGHRRNPYHGPLRRITVARDDPKAPLVLATNDLERPAAEIATLYKARWQIELFFKWLKQNLRIKRFYGRSENAVKIQIYIALITYLLVWFYRRQLGLAKSLKQCKVWIAATLFQRPETDYQRWRRRKKREWEWLQRQGALF